AVQRQHIRLLQRQALQGAAQALLRERQRREQPQVALLLRARIAAGQRQPGPEQQQGRQRGAHPRRDTDRPPGRRRGDGHAAAREGGGEAHGWRVQRPSQGATILPGAGAATTRVRHAPCRPSGGRGAAVPATLRPGGETMDAFEAARTMLAVRRYQDKPVPEDVGRRIVEAGPPPGGALDHPPPALLPGQPPRAPLLLLGSPAQTGPYIRQAARAIAVAVEQAPYAVSDASRAIQSMLLAAWNDGVGSNWVGFGGLDAAKPLLGIPAELDLLAII